MTARVTLKKSDVEVVFKVSLVGCGAVSSLPAF